MGVHAAALNFHFLFFTPRRAHKTFPLFFVSYLCLYILEDAYIYMYSPTHTDLLKAPCKPLINCMCGVVKGNCGDDEVICVIRSIDACFFFLASVCVLHRTGGKDSVVWYSVCCYCFCFCLRFFALPLSPASSPKLVLCCTHELILKNH